MSGGLLGRLNLSGAAATEAQSHGNLLPKPPGIDRLMRHSENFIDWLQGRLRAGLVVTPQVVASARKPGHGVRPVPVWAFSERVLYRALTDLITAQLATVDRSPLAYLKFVMAPIDYARSRLPRRRIRAHIIGSIDIQYVVKSDIVAFYQFIDHEILANELLMQTGESEAINALIELLQEVQGKSFGIPQLLDPSDSLSDLYIDIMERSLLRQGLALWRFNDDFRIACKSYPDALRAIEQLDAAARDIGLVIGDLKTTTPKFIKYALDVTGLEVDQALAKTEEQDPEAVVADYSEMFDEELGVAIQTIESGIITREISRHQDGLFDLHSLTLDQTRKCKRAWKALARNGDARQVPHTVRYLRYAPSLTPVLAEFLAASFDADPSAVAEVVDEICSDVALSDWQQVWVVSLIRKTGFLDDGSPGDVEKRQRWTSQLVQPPSSHLLRAEAFLALASGAQISLAEAISAFSDAPDVLSNWYLEACRLAARGDDSQATAKQLRAVAGDRPPYRWVLE